MKNIFTKILIITLAVAIVQCKSTDKRNIRKNICEKDVSFTHLGKYVSGLTSSRQGAAIYGNYLVQAHHPAGYSIFDIPSRVALKTGRLQPAADNNHANNLCFSDRFFDESDQFPLLYVSENHTSCIAVNRLASFDSEFELVQHITLPEKIGYYLNAVFDFSQHYIYTVCFRDKNWRTSENGNHLIVSKLRLPGIIEGDVVIDNVIEQFDLPFRTAIQGAFFTNGLIVHGFGINANDDDGLLVIDPHKKCVVREIKTHDIFQDEIEGVSPYGNSILVTIQHGDVYQVKFDMIK